MTYLEDSDAKSSSSSFSVPIPENERLKDIPVKNSIISNVTLKRGGSTSPREICSANVNN